MNVAYLSLIQWQISHTPCEWAKCPMWMRHMSHVNESLTSHVNEPNVMSRWMWQLSPSFNMRNTSHTMWMSQMSCLLYVCEMKRITSPLCISSMRSNSHLSHMSYEWGTCDISLTSLYDSFQSHVNEPYAMCGIRMAPGSFPIWLIHMGCEWAICELAIQWMCHVSHSLYDSFTSHVNEPYAMCMRSTCVNKRMAPCEWAYGSFTWNVNESYRDVRDMTHWLYG